MPRNGSGVYTLPAGNPVISGTSISSVTQNNTMSDVAAELTNSIAADGQKVPTANLPMGGFRHTGVLNANARDQYAAVGQVQDSSFLWCGTAGGTANAITFSPIPAITAYAAGQVFRFQAGAAGNNGATTVAISGLPAIDLEMNGAPCVGNEIAANNWYELLLSSTTKAQLSHLGDLSANLTTAFNDKRSTVALTATTSPIWTDGVGRIIDGTGTPTITDFPAAPQAGAQREVYPAAGSTITSGGNITVQGNQNAIAAAGDKWIINAVTTSTFYVEIVKKDGSAVGNVIPNHISGLTLSTVGASSTITVAAGYAANSDNTAMMRLASAISKTTSAWSVGTAAGGLDSGTIANSTWYNFYEIRRPDTGVVDVCFSTSASSPTLPTNYTQYRRIGAGKTNGSAQWTKFIQDGDLFQWDVAVLDVDVTAPGSSAVTRTLASVPTGVNVQARFNYGAYDPTNANQIISYFSDLAVSDQAPSGTVAPLGTSVSAATNSTGGLNFMQVRTNTSAQIRTRVSNAGGTVVLKIATLGWIDTRGKDA